MTDLIMRPTELEPGMYTAHDEDGPYAFAVAVHTDGKTYELIWCENGSDIFEAGDLLFKDAQITGHRVDYPKDGTVEVTPIECEPWRL
jgi:hypothetical protein